MYSATETSRTTTQSLGIAVTQSTTLPGRVSIQNSGSIFFPQSILSAGGWTTAKFARIISAANDKKLYVFFYDKRPAEDSGKGVVFQLFKLGSGKRAPYATAKVLENPKAVQGASYTAGLKHYMPSMPGSSTFLNISLTTGIPFSPTAPRTATNKVVATAVRATRINNPNVIWYSRIPPEVEHGTVNIFNNGIIYFNAEFYRYYNPNNFKNVEMGLRMGINNRPTHLLIKFVNKATDASWKITLPKRVVQVTSFFNWVKKTYGLGFNEGNYSKAAVVDKKSDSVTVAVEAVR